MVFEGFEDYFVFADSEGQNERGYVDSFIFA